MDRGHKLLNEGQGKSVRKSPHPCANPVPAVLTLLTEQLSFPAGVLGGIPDRASVDTV